MIPCATMLHRLSRALATVFVFGVAPIFAQPSPRPLTHADFDSWRNIATPILSRDGQWLAYSFMPQDGDGDLILREVSTGREHRVPVGALPSPAAGPVEEGANPEAPPPPRNIRVAFTGDSQFAVATTHPKKAELAAARKAKKKPDEMPKGGLVMVKLATGEVTRVASVKSFQVPAKGGAWTAYLKEARPGEAKPEEASGEEKPAEPAPANEEEAENDDAAAPRTAGGAASTPGARTYGTELVLRNLESGSERSFASVTDYSLTRDGRTLLYAVSSRTQAENGVYLATPGDASESKAILSGRGRYSRLMWDREQTQAAFVSDRDTAGSRTTRFKLYHWPRGATEAKPVVTAETRGVPAGMVVSNNASASFSRDGAKLFVPVAIAPKPPRSPASAPAEEEKVTADLWHWRDGFIQPMQKSRATQERNRTYRGVLDLASGIYVQLADQTMATVTTSDDGARTIGYDDRAYRQLVDHDGRFTDIYLVNASTGERKLALKQLRGEAGSGLQWSPDGKWAAYYQDRQWRVIDTATGATQSLTAKLRVAFHNEDVDRPEPPGAYGSAGWLKDSASFLVYDRFDVWQLFADGRAPRNVTAGHGRSTKVQLRVQRVEPIDEDDDERGIDPAKSLVLRGESEETRATGFFRTTLTAASAPERLAWGDKNHRYVGRARDADALLVTASRFDEFPDLHVTDASFSKLRKVSDGGAQLAPFSWGSAELVRFRNADGVPLQAALYKPANFDPKKKYPVIIYLYERLSQNVHAFVNPAPGTSINTSHYVSNGYVVLMPDIVYKTGQPGQSALRCVLPALDAIVGRGFVDEKAVGIQGHSWGGYQIAYMLTQTDRFRAAEAGAPVGNMTSAYSGIRWGSGLPRQFQYETGQSRIGRSLQSATKLFLENSPVFHIERVKTPVLIISNDNDDMVPWYQGIELFLALRRHGKPAWLFNYNGEFHGLRRRANQKDWAKRMNQFFDHYLKGAPAPKWLEEGIPFIEREEEKERFNAPATPGQKAEAEPVAASAP
jgi:dipeptidyl aminopeptidase/acylaminoacyl peptidase